MKRLIKFVETYNDGPQFSDCGQVNGRDNTVKYTIYPVLVDDTAGDTELLTLALAQGLPSASAVPVENQRRYNVYVTNAVQIGTVEVSNRHAFRPESETKRVYLAFISLPKHGPLAPVESPDTELTEEQVRDICGHGGVYGFSDYGETVGGETILVKEDWGYWHALRLLGYSLESFEKALGVTDHGFSDDTDRCDECQKFDSRDNGYTYNFRYVESCGHNLGVRCGCYQEWAESPEALNAYADDTENAMELDAAKTHEKAGNIEFVERFIGGMVDGRGGSYDGESVREGKPEKILAELKKANPDDRFIFTHDESGQFQTYFSVWRITE